MPDDSKHDDFILADPEEFMMLQLHINSLAQYLLIYLLTYSNNHTKSPRSLADPEEFTMF